MNTAFAVGVLFLSLWMLTALPAGILLILGYVRSRLSGLLWLLFAVVVWPPIAHEAPFIAGLLGIATGSVRVGSLVLPSIVLVSAADTLTGGVLLLTGTLVLYRELRTRMPERAVSVPVASRQAGRTDV